MSFAGLLVHRRMLYALVNQSINTLKQAETCDPFSAKQNAQITLLFYFQNTLGS